MVHNLEQRHTVHCEKNSFLYIVHGAETKEAETYLIRLLI